MLFVAPPSHRFCKHQLLERFLTLHSVNDELEQLVVQNLRFADLLEGEPRGLKGTIVRVSLSNGGLAEELQDPFWVQRQFLSVIC